MATDMLELKKKAVKYYYDNQIPQQFESLLKSMFYEQPEDLYGYISEHFAKLSKPPRVSKITCAPSFSSNNHENVTAKVECCVKGKIKTVAKLQTFTDNQPIIEPVISKTHSVKGGGKRDGKSKGGKKDQIQEQEHDTPVGKPKCVFSYRKFVSLLEGDVIPLLEGVEVWNQHEIDEKLRELALHLIQKDSLSSEIPQVESLKSTLNVLPVQDEGSSSKIMQPNESIQNSTSIVASDNTTTDIQREANMACLFASTILAVTAARLKELPLYERLQGGLSEAISLPVFAVPLISCDSSSPGKLNVFKEVLVSVKPSIDIAEAMNHVMLFVDNVEIALVTKFGASGHARNSRGVFAPAFDKAEQVFEFLVATSRTTMDVEFSEVFDLIVNVGADQLFDDEKKKYDVAAGSQKSTDDMITMYKSWIDTFPVVALIDALSLKDEIENGALFSELFAQCLILTTKAKTIVEAEKLLTEKHCDGVVLHPDGFTSTISDMFTSVDAIKELGGNIMFADEWCNVVNSEVVVDMSIAMNALFLRTSPKDGAASYMNRLLEAYQDLKDRNLLTERTDYVHTLRPQSSFVSDAEGEAKVDETAAER